MFTTIQTFRHWRRETLLSGKTVGFVPTMGALHAGHMSLATQAANDADVVCLSIFVNPAQFSPTEDLATYPRTLQADLETLKETLPDKACVVLAPSVAEMYPNGITLDRAQQEGAFVEVLGLSHQLEGKTRPHFFRGVATVVTKLFNIVQPEHAYFGQKDVQQCMVLRRMVRDLHLPVQLHIGPTARAEDGLALSSRNAYLTEDQRHDALALYAALSRMQSLYDLGMTDADTLRDAGKELLSNFPNVRLDYISVASPDTLKEIQGAIDPAVGAVMSGAVYVGTTRLIDNFLIDAQP